MPPVSAAQRRAMAAAAAGKSNIGIPKSVGQEFMEADPGGKLPERKQAGGATDPYRPRQVLRSLGQQARGAWGEVPGQVRELAGQVATAMNPFSEYGQRGEAVHGLSEALYGGAIPALTGGFASPGLPEAEAPIGRGPGAASRAAYAVRTSEVPDIVHTGHEIGEAAPQAATGLGAATPAAQPNPMIGGQPRLPYTPQAATDPATMREGGSAGLGSQPSMQFGGEVGRLGMMTSADMPYWTRSEARQVMDQPFGGGLIPSSGAGRTDQLPLAVAAESHVLPADVVAGVGQGNTMSGSRLMMAALSRGPWGMPPAHVVHGRGPPRAPAPAQEGSPSQVLSELGSATGTGAGTTTRTRTSGYADAGSTSDKSTGGAKHQTSILAAGGEFVIPREDWVARDEHGNLNLHAGVRTLGGGDIAAGHQVLNQMIHKIRAHNLSFLKHAPPPKE